MTGKTSCAQIRRKNILEEQEIYRLWGKEELCVYRSGGWWQGGPGGVSQRVRGLGDEVREHWDLKNPDVEGFGHWRDVN